MKRILMCFLLSSFLLPLHAQEEDFDRLIRKGIELQEYGYFSSALKCYQQGLAVRPESMIPYFEMAQCYAAMNRHKDSRKCAEKILLNNLDTDKTETITVYLDALALYVTLVIANRPQDDKTVKNE